MPRKTKEQKELENNENIEKVTKKTTRKTTTKADDVDVVEKVASTKKTTTKKTATAKKSAAEKETKKSASDVKEKASTKKKSASSATKSTSKKASTKSTATKKASTTKTSAAKKSSTRRTTTTKKAATKKIAIKDVSSTRKIYTKKKTNSITTEKPSIVEYYDLPYRYNQTVVKVLAQTPTNLFIYWDISDEDRENYKKQYGERFFEETKPVLIVHNKTLGYSFEIDINDFANSWYLHVNDAKCDYVIELGRRPIVLGQQINTDYIYVSTSNQIEVPNDRVLFNKEQKMIYFRNVKTGEQYAKPITSLSFIRNMGRIYHIYDLYKEIYQEKDIEDLFSTSNPSSGNPSSGTFSSRFK